MTKSENKPRASTGRARPAARVAPRVTPERRKRGTMPDSLQPARWRLKAEALEKLDVYLYEAPWQAVAQAVAQDMTPADFKGKRYGSPTGALNRTLRVMAPGLVCGFRRKANGALEPAVALDGRVPSAELMHRIIMEWARAWGRLEENRQRIPELAGRVQPLLDELERQGPGMWRKVSAAEALQSNLKYTVVPSLLAARFAAGGASRIDHEAIAWRLEQGSSHELNVVSAVQTNAVQGGSWAYLIRFSLQYQPGTREPWVHVRVICQRYVDEPLTAGRRQQQVTVMLKLQQPLQPDWQAGFSETLIDLPVRTSGHSFEDTLTVALLNRTRLRQIVAQPQQILDNPRQFRQPSGDEYLVIYAEGYRPGHQLDSGVSPRELEKICEHVARRLSDLLVPGGPLPRVETPRAARALEAWRKTEGNASDGAGKASLRWQAIRAATGCSQLRILLVCPAEEQNTADTMEAFLGRLLDPEAWPARSPLPEGLTVTRLAPPPALYRNLAVEPYAERTRLTVEDRRERKDSRRQDEQRLARGWRDFLASQRGPDGELALAWIVLPQASDYVSAHDAIRQACIQAGMLSQMLTPVHTPVEKLLDMGRYHGAGQASEEFGRVFNAAADLLLRQTGVSGGDRLRGTLQDDYEQAGFSPDVAERITTIGLTLLSSNRNQYYGRGSVSVPVAIRVLPSGQMEARLGIPGRSSQWLRYPAAALELGRTFLSLGHGQALCARPEAIQAFCRDVVSELAFGSATGTSPRPTLCLLDANALRGEWPYLQVGQLQAGQLRFGGEYWREAQWPHLNAVWVRYSGSGLDETPRYIGPAVPYLGLFKDVEAGGQGLTSYFSVGQIAARKIDPDAMRRESEKAQRSPQLVELVPFFGSERETAAKAAHLLRAAPNWHQGNLRRPYVLHLAGALFDDLEPLLGLVDGEDEND